MTNTKEELRRMMQGIRHDLELAFEGELKNADGEPVDLWEYLADGLALDYRVDPDKSPTSVPCVVDRIEQDGGDKKGHYSQRRASVDILQESISGGRRG